MEFPEFVLTRKFDSYYLFLEHEIVGNEFSSMLDLWIDVLQTRHFIIELNVSDKIKAQFVSTNFIVPSANIKTLKDFHKLQCNIGEDYLFLDVFDYWLRDSSLAWEGYASSTHEICVFGCNDIIKHTVNGESEDYYVFHVKREIYCLDRDASTYEYDRSDSVDSAYPQYKYIYKYKLTLQKRIMQWASLE